MSKKIVLKAALNCEKCKRRAMTTVAGIEGVDSIDFDEKDNKITVIGDADPVSLTTSLRKFGFAELVSVGPSQEPDKKPVEENEPDKEPDDKQEGLQQKITCVVLQTSCDPRNGYTYYCWDQNPNASSIS